MLLEVTLRSLYISGTATLIATAWSMPIAYLLAKGRGRRVLPVLEAPVGVPTVLIGLFLYFLLCSKCPLGFLHLLYTPQAIIIGESILVTPLLISTMYRVLKDKVETYWETAITLGATEGQAFTLAINESLSGLIASIVMAFSRAIGELGIALLVGGNIKGYTRTLTTAIALEVSKGEFENAMGLGLVLLLLTLVISIVLRTYVRD